MLSLGFYSLDEYKDIYRTKLSTLINKLQDREKYKSIVNAQRNTLETLMEDAKKIEAAQHISELYKFNINQLANLNKLVRIRDEGVYTPDKMLCSSIECRKAFHDFYFENLVSYRNEIKKKIEDKNLTEAALNDCKNSLAERFFKRYSTKKLNKKTPSIKKKFISSINKLYSKETVAAFSEYLEKNVSFVNDSINEKPGKSYSSEIIREFSKEASVTNPLTANTLVVFLEDYTQNGFASLCKGGGSTLWDMAIVHEAETDNKANTASIILSKFSNFNPKVAELVISHEITHLLSDYLSKNASASSRKKIDEQRSCVSSMYEGFYAIQVPSHRWPNDYLKTEEDFADALAFFIESQDSQKSKKNEKFMGCYMLDHNLHNIQEYKIDIVSLSHSHSESFFRILHQLFYSTRSIPHSCKSVLNKYKPIIEPKRCIGNDSGRNFLD